MVKLNKRAKLGVVLSTALIAGAVVLFARNRALPEASPHAVAAPDLSALPKLRACWVEYGRNEALGQVSTAGITRTSQWDVTVAGLLVRHPKGDAVVDVGNSSHFTNEIADYPLATRTLLELIPGSNRTVASAPAALMAAGVNPNDLTVLLSHIHVDHAGGLVDLPKARVLIPREEIEFAGSHRDDHSFQVVAAHARTLDGRTQALAFEPKPYETFDESADVFGDGAVVVVKLFGHTPGSVGIFVNVSPKLRFFHVGDAVNVVEAVDRRLTKSVVMGITDNAPEEANRTVSRIAQLHAAKPENRHPPCARPRGMVRGLRRARSLRRVTRLGEGDRQGEAVRLYSRAVLDIRSPFAGAVLLASFAGCHANEPVAGTAAGPGPHVPAYEPLPADAGAAADAVGPQASSDAGPAPPSFAVPPKEPLATAELALKPGEPMPKRALPAGKRLGRGGVVPPGIPAPDRVAIATTDRKGVLVDARTGKVILALPAEPRDVSPRAGVIVLEGQPARLVRLHDAALLTPTIDAGGRTLKGSWLAATDAHPRAIALAETPAGEKLAGLASDDLSSFKVAPVPLEPSGVRYSATTNAIHWQLSAPPQKALGIAGHGTPFSLPHAEACVRAKVADDGTISCLEYLPSPGTAIFAWLDEGWIAGEKHVTHVSFGAKQIPFEDAPAANAMCFTRASRAVPSRAVGTCHKGGDAIVWAPGKRYTFKGPADPNDIGGLLGADAGPVLPIAERSGSLRADEAEGRTATRWLDLVGLRLLTSPKLRPLAIASFAGVESLALAEDRHDKTSDVYLLDFEKATRELVAKVTDCPGVLGELREPYAKGRRRWLTLACMTVPAAHSVAQNLLWSEIVDLETRVRWRTPLVPEAFFPDGVVVLSSRRVLGAESKTAPGELFSVDLVTP